MDRYTLDRQNPQYKEGRRLAAELRHDQILAEARVSVYIILDM